LKPTISEIKNFAEAEKRKAIREDSGTYQDNMTLDEIAENDLEMSMDAIKDANKYGFGNNREKAFLFVRHCMDNTLRRLGIFMRVPKTEEARKEYAKKLDRVMTEKKIRIENRNRYTGADIWRCGIYIYRNDELVAFISDILTENRTEVDPVTMKLMKQDIGCFVITNARVDNDRRIFVPRIIGGGKA